MDQGTQCLVNAWLVVAHNSTPHETVCDSFMHIEFPSTEPIIQAVRAVLRNSGSDAELRLALAFMLLQRDVLKQPCGLSDVHRDMLARDSTLNNLVCLS